MKIKEIPVKFVLSDGSEAIIKAVKSTLPGPPTHLLCWFHMTQAVERQMKEKLIQHIRASYFGQ
jgi:hypothetical protein